ncbi:MAG TPA: hypothetical protein PLO37_22165 [Candidatus Hydrogenedentes bacterium]|nr:hypothetical protein [Candidatus Hydrogenedentota bacterium]HPG69562.1 hypothetical protein [Candidatus Hydrogenedentota bacterium]
MGVLSEALSALRRNAAAVLIYVVLSGGVNAARRACDYVVASQALFVLDDYALRGYQFIMDLGLGLGYAFACVLAFTRMGRQIDRPLWKVPNDREAIRRFLLLWFLIGLCGITILRVFERLVETDPGEGTLALMQTFYFLTFVLSIPVGACIMFPGRLDWREVAADLAPLLRQFARTLIIISINFLLFIFHLLLLQFFYFHPQARSDFWLLTITDIPFALVDCLVFAATWMLCITDRRQQEERNRTSGFDL